jgi:maltooligosyltrehalose trehalohydrolase
VYALYADLLHLRREDPVFGAGRAGGASRSSGVDGAVLGSEALALRFLGTHGGDHRDDRLVLVNLGRDFNPRIVPEPLLAPPDGCVWELLFSTEAPRYGGGGTALIETADGWRVPGHAAVVMRPRPAPARIDLP